MQLEDIFSYYNLSEVKRYEIIDSSRSDKDKRINILTEDINGVRLVIKLTNNTFTTKERVEGWAKLAKLYRSLGIYSPLFIKTKTKEISKNVEIDGTKYIMFCEEFKKHPSLTEVKDIKNKDIIYNKVKEAVGLIATKSKDLVAWNTAYCLYDKFSSDDLYDENYENALNFYNLSKKKLPQYKDKIGAVWNLYNFKRENLKVRYQQLPAAVFQGDLNQSNILVDEKDEFVGLIDYNLSGTEKVINYILSEFAPTPSLEGDLPYLMDEDFLKKADDQIRFDLSLITKHYSLNKLELDSFSNLYNIVVPFRWPTLNLFRFAINNKSEYFDNIINWIYYQLSREFVLFE